MQVYIINKMIFNISEIMFSVAAADAPPQPQVDGTAPTFSKKPTIRQEDSGNTLVFHCAIVADPLPQITWYHNGVKVQDTAKYQVTSFHVVLSLELFSMLFYVSL